METIEQLYNRNPKAIFKLQNGRNRVFIYLSKHRKKDAYYATCKMGNRVILNPNEIVIETI